VTCISSSNHIVPSVFYGCVAAGGVLSSVSSASTVKDLVRLIKGAPSDLVVCNDDTKAVAAAAARECGLSPDRVLIIDSGKTGTLRSLKDGKDVVGKQMLDWERITSKEELERRVATLIYSSGTTGLPKGMTSSTFLVCTHQFASVVKFVSVVD
jgi:4-coumarate--CoA ligase